MAGPTPSGQRTGHRDRVGSMAVLLGLVAVTAVVSAVFWPGHMNNDTLGNYQYAAAFHYTDWHSAIWTAIWTAMLLAGLKSPGWMLSAGVLMLLAGLYLILRARMARLWALVFATLVLLFPPVLAFAIEIGNDVWFAAPMICGFGFAVTCARTRGAARTASAVLTLLFAWLAMAARPTAAPPVFALLCALAVAVVGSRLRGWRRPLTVAAAGAVGTVLAFGSVLTFQSAVLHTEQWHPEQATYEYDLVGLSIYEHKVLLPADVYPRQDLSYLTVYGMNSKGAVDISPLLWGSYAAIPPIVEGTRLADLQNAWIAALGSYPYGYLRTRVHSGLVQLGFRGAEYGVWYGPTPSYYGFGPVLLPAVQSRFNDYVALGTGPDASGGPLQTVWIYMVVLVIAAAYLLGRRPENPVLGLLGVALLLYTAAVIVLSPAITYRYAWPAVTAATVLIPILAVDVAGRMTRRAAPRPAGATPGPATDGLERRPAALTRRSD